MTARRGWRERVEPGLYRAHRLGCRSSEDQKPCRRCECPWQVKAPGMRPGTTRTVTVYGSVGDARAERRRLMAAGRPAPEVEIESGTLTEFTASYLRAKAPLLSSETIRNREDDFNRRIAPALGHLELVELTRERVEVWLADLVQRAPSRRMVVQSVATLRVILATAVEWGRLPENPAAKLTVPAPQTNAEQVVERVIGAERMALLFRSAGALRTETMLRAAGEGGLRRGEVAGLRWPDVDLAARRLDVRRSIVQERAREGAPMRKVAKTPKGRRSRRVAISETLAARLADLYAESVVEGGADAAGFVWPGANGGPMHDRSLARALERACRRADLVDQEGKPLVSPHGLRHSCASIMLARGVPLIVVSRQLGHANPNITAQVYAHLLGDAQLDDAAAAFATLGPAEGQGAGGRQVASPTALTVRETVREEEIDPKNRMTSGIQESPPAAL